MTKGRTPPGLHSAATVDHLVYAAPEFSEGVARIQASLGVEPDPGGRHPRWGTRNALVGLGPGTYLEILGPDLEAPDPPSPRPFDLDSRSEPGLAGWAVRMTDVEAGARAAGLLDLDLGEIMEGSRETSDGEMLRWRLTDPAVGRERGTVPFLIDWGRSPHPSGSLDHPLRLHRLHLRHPDPGPLRALVRGLAGSVVVKAGDAPGLRAVLGTPHGRVELT